MTKQTELNEILVLLWKNFWPAELLTPRGKAYSEKNLKVFYFFFFSYLCIGYISTTFMLSPGLFSKELTLPLSGIYPFPTNWKPFHEFLIVWQYIQSYTNMFILVAFDGIFLSLLVNIVIQFKVLQDVIKGVNAVKNKDFFEKYSKIGYQGKGGLSGSVENEILIKCIHHHRLLIR